MQYREDDAAGADVRVLKCFEWGGRIRIPLQLDYVRQHGPLVSLEIWDVPAAPAVERAFLRDRSRRRFP